MRTKLFATVCIGSPVATVFRRCCVMVIVGSVGLLFTAGYAFFFTFQQIQHCHGSIGLFFDFERQFDRYPA